jgi:NADH dehydrogenase [ubiquinone] 1 alpha subcomplex assembly factor 1
MRRCATPLSRILTAALAITTCAATAAADDEEASAMREHPLFTFTETDASDAWTTVHDTVMGGVSTGQVRISDEQTMIFAGAVSLENNGGFASVRGECPTSDLAAYDGLHLRIRGDGRKYSLSIRTDLRVAAGAYYHDIETRDGEWQEIDVAWTDFRVRSFGRPIPGAPPLNTRDIRSIGFIIADKQAGPFRLEVDRIVAIARGQTAEPSRERASAAARDLIEQAIARGVPLFNDDQPAACAAIYEITARSIVTLADDDLPDAARAALRNGLAAAEATRDPSARAWALRHALDAAWSLLRGDAPPEGPAVRAHKHTGNT